MDVLHVLSGNLHDGNVINIYFVFVNQMQKKIQRTLKCLQFYGNSHLSSFLSAFLYRVLFYLIKVVFVKAQPCQISIGSSAGLKNRGEIVWSPRPALTQSVCPSSSKTPLSYFGKSWNWGLMTPPIPGIRI